MKNYFKSDLQGKNLIKPYLLFFIPLVIISAISEPVNNEIFGFSIVFSLLEGYIYSLLTFVIIRFIIRGVSYNEETLIFEGETKEFASKILIWLALNIITLGIYYPWYITNYLNYFLDRTSYSNNKIEFLSKPKSLLKIMLLLVYLPLVIMTIIFSLFLFRRISYYHQSWENLIAPIAIFSFACILVFLPYIFYFYKWLINAKYNENFIYYNKTISETISFFLLQIFLTIITLGIYFPVLIVKSCRFLLEAISITDQDNNSQGGCKFSGKTSKGFGLIWGQSLLTFITLGIYAPWAISRVSNWFINNTCINIKKQERS